MRLQKEFLYKVFRGSAVKWGNANGRSLINDITSCLGPKECFSRLRHFYPLTTHRVPKSKILFKKSISSQMTFFGFQKSSLHGFQKPCLHEFQNPSLLGFYHPSLDFKSFLFMDFSVLLWISKLFFAWISKSFFARISKVFLLQIKFKLG